MFATLLAHVVGGTTEYLLPSFAMPAPAGWMAVQEVIWHFISAFLALTSIALGWATFQSSSQRPLLNFIAAHQVVFAFLFFVYAMIWLGSPLLLPQWIAFLATLVFLAVDRFQQRRA